MNGFRLNMSLSRAPHGQRYPCRLKRQLFVGLLMDWQGQTIVVIRSILIGDQIVNAVQMRIVS